MLGLGGGCRVVDPDHCAHRVDAEGRTEHAWCMAEHGLPYCDRCRPSSVRGGCSDERPAAGECLQSEPDESSSGTSGTSGEGSEESGPAACEPEGFHDSCAALDPLAPFCQEGQCVPCEDALCPSGACDPRPAAACVECRPDAEGACPETAPFCGADLECTDACTRHEQCPASACDLGAGFCIPPQAAVAWVDGNLEPSEAPQDPSQCRSIPGADWRAPVTYCDLETALADAPNPAVIRLRPAANAYKGPLVVAEQRTVVLMAEPGEPRVPLRLTGTLDPYLLRTSPSSRVYLQGLVLRGVGELGSAVGVDCEGATGEVTELWLDDVEVTAFETGVRANGCNVQLRRASIHDVFGIGVDVALRSVTLQSSVVARNGGVGLRAEATTAIVQFSSLLDNGQAGGTVNLECVGTAEGRAHGSVVLHPDALGLSVACSNDAFSFERSLTDLDLSGRYREIGELFSDIPTAALRDPQSNPITELGLVPWQLHDPYLDIDGQPRPRVDRPLITPGANEP